MTTLYVHNGNFGAPALGSREEFRAALRAIWADWHRDYRMAGGELSLDAYIEQSLDDALQPADADDIASIERLPAVDPSIPDASRYNSDPAYIRSLVEQIKARRALSQRGTAAQIGAGWTSLKDWMSGKAKIPYACQFALERLASEQTTNDTFSC